MDEITTLLRDLAAQLGTTVELLWPALVANAKIHSLVHLILAPIVLIGAVLFSWRTLASGFALKDKETAQGVITLALGCVAAVFVIFAGLPLIDQFAHNVGNYFHPEKLALQSLLGHLR